MEIVVNDTNILIDLYNCGLLSHCNKLNFAISTIAFTFISTDIKFLITQTRPE